MGETVRRRWVLAAAVILIVSTVLFVGMFPHVEAVRSDDGEMDTEWELLEASVTSVGDSSITVAMNGEEVELLTGGRWLLLGEYANKTSWIDAMNHVERGDALVAVLTIRGENATNRVLLGLKQGDLFLFRARFLERSVKKHLRTRVYMGVRGEIAEKYGNYFVIDRGGLRAYVFVGGSWRKAGDGEVSWSDVSEEFRIGDEVRIFCHNIAVMNDKFADSFGIKAFIWGYSGAIMDLTSGAAISKK